MNCQQAREQASVALLSRHEPDTLTSSHLSSCAECRSMWERLSPLPRLLNLVADPALRHPEPPGEELLDRLFARVRRRRIRRRWYTGLAAAAAVLLLAIPLGLITARELGGQAGRPATAAGSAAAAGTAVTRSARDASTGVWVDVEVQPVAWGSDLTFAIGGVARGTRCSLIVFTADGSHQVAGNWWSTGRNYAKLHGSVAANLNEITHIDLVDDSTGAVLLPVRMA